MAVACERPPGAGAFALGEDLRLKVIRRCEECPGPAEVTDMRVIDADEIEIVGERLDRSFPELPRRVSRPCDREPWVAIGKPLTRRRQWRDYAGPKC